MPPVAEPTSPLSRLIAATTGWFRSTSALSSPAAMSPRFAPAARYFRSANLPRIASRLALAAFSSVSAATFCLSRAVTALARSGSSEPDVLSTFATAASRASASVRLFSVSVSFFVVSVSFLSASVSLVFVSFSSFSKSVSLASASFSLTSLSFSLSSVTVNLDCSRPTDFLASAACEIAASTARESLTSSFFSSPASSSLCRACQ